MDSPKLSCFLFLAAISLCIAASGAHMYSVGGKRGWVQHPEEAYSEWSARHIFAVNDELSFKYKNGDSVLQVSKEAFDTCNSKDPIWKADDERSFFTLYKTGPFYFISGIKEHCDNGQKLFVNVTSGGPPSHAPSSAPSHAPSPAPSHAPSLAPSHAPSPAPSSEHPGSESPPPAPSAASGVLGAPAFTAALVGFVFGLMVVF